MSLLWLLILIPPALAIVLGAPVELASVVPPVVVLAVVGWSSRARSPLALRTRKELRLALIPAVLMLLVTGSGALLAASLSPALDALFRTLLYGSLDCAEISPQTANRLIWWNGMMTLK